MLLRRRLTRFAPNCHIGWLCTPKPVNTAYHGPEVTKLSDITPTTVRWLWPDRLALGKLTLLAGDPGLGKSYLTLDLAARVSSGTPFPGDTDNKYGNHPRKVILLSAEDDPADTIRPRLDAAGADPDHVLLMQGIRLGENVRCLNLRDDIKHLNTLVESLEEECRLIIIDPISAYLGDDDGHSNTKVRNLLAPLAKLAQDHHLAVLAVTHLNKGSSQGGAQNAIYRTMGSLAFTAAARAVHLVAREPNDPTGQRRLMLPIKNNLGHDRTGWAFELKSAEHPRTGRVETKIHWDKAPTQETADALLNRLGRSTPDDAPRPTPAMDEAIDFLKSHLATGPQPAKAVQQAADHAGIAAMTLKRAKALLGIESRREGFASDAHYLWSLPAPGSAPQNALDGSADSPSLPSPAPQLFHASPAALSPVGGHPDA